MSTIPLSHFTLDFEGKPLTTVAINGVPGWPAHEIGARLGYGNGGRRLVTSITGEWADEFIENHDYVKISGRELTAVKAMTGQRPDGLSPHTSQVLMLLEPGLDLALVKTHKPIGKRLRRFLVDEVLPRLRRGQAIGGEGASPAPEAKPEPAARPMLSMTELREVRLWRATDLADRRFRAGAISSMGRWLHSLGRIDLDALVRFEVLSTQVALACAPAGMLPAPVANVDMRFVLDELNRVAA